MDLTKLIRKNNKKNKTFKKKQLASNKVILEGREGNIIRISSTNHTNYRKRIKEKIQKMLIGVEIQSKKGMTKVNKKKKKDIVIKGVKNLK